MSDNLDYLLHFYSLATDADKKDWYKEAHDILKAEAEKMGLPEERAYAICAVLSPKLGWGANLDAAITCIRGGYPRFGFKKNRAKAMAIREGDMTQLRGQKVQSFAKNLAMAGGGRDVTVDIWAYRAWAGDMNIAYDESNLTPTVYKAIARDYRAGAELVDETPARFQAIIWVVVRRLYSKDFYNQSGK